MPPWAVRAPRRREQADEDRGRRPQRERGRHEGDDTGQQGVGVDGRGADEGGGDGRARPGDQPGAPAPAVGPVAGPDAAPPAQAQAREGHGQADEQDGQPVRGALGGEQPVRARTHAEQAAEGEDVGGVPDGGRDLCGTAVAAGVHRGGDGDGAFQGALQDGQADLEDRRDAAGGTAAQAPGGPQSGDVGDHVRREGHGDDDGDTGLVEGGREDFSNRAGLARAFAAPTQTRRAASLAPS